MSGSAQNPMTALLLLYLLHLFGVQAEYCSRIIDGAQMSFENELRMEDQLVESGSRTGFECVVVSAPQASIAWYRNGILLSSEDGAEAEYTEWEGKGNIIGLGVIKSTLLIPCADIRVAGEYTCRASSPCSKTIDTSARLNIIPQSGTVCPTPEASAPAITTMTSSRLEFGQNMVQLMCRAVGEPKPDISWYLEDSETEGKFTLVNDSETTIRLANGDLLVSAPDDETASQTFRCSARNQHGEDHKDASVVYLEADRRRRRR